MMLSARRLRSLRDDVLLRPPRSRRDERHGHAAVRAHASADGRTDCRHGGPCAPRALPATASIGRVRFCAGARAPAAGPFASEYGDEISRLRSEIEDRTAVNVAANWYGIAYGQMLLERYDDAAASLASSRAAFATGEQAEGGTARSSPSLDVFAADIARRAGRDDEAARLAELAQKRWPQSNAAIDMHLRTLLTSRRFADAQALARKETRAQPDQPAWWLYLAQASAGTGDALTAASGDGREVRARGSVAFGDPAIEGRARPEGDRLLRPSRPSTRGCMRWRAAIRRSGWTRRVTVCGSSPRAGRVVA